MRRVLVFEKDDGDTMLMLLKESGIDKGGKNITVPLWSWEAFFNANEDTRDIAKRMESVTAEADSERDCSDKRFCCSVDEYDPIRDRRLKRVQKLSVQFKSDTCRNALVNKSELSSKLVEGCTEGCPEGRAEGCEVGLLDGSPEGCLEGFDVGFIEGCPEGCADG